MERTAVGSHETSTKFVVTPQLSAAEYPLLERLFARVCALPWAGFLATMALLTLLRCGYRRYRAIEPLLEFAQQFPVPSASYKAASVIGPAFAHVLGIVSMRGYWRLHMAVMALLVIVAGFLLARAAEGREERRALAILLLIGAAPVVLLQLIGHYDVYALFGALLLGFTSSAPLALLAGIVLGLSNAEQGILMAASAALIGQALGRTRSNLLVSFVVGTVVARAVVMRWFAAYAWDGGERMSLLGDHLPRSLSGFLRTGTAAIYSWHGPLWCVVALVLWAHRGDMRRFALLFVGLVALPGLAAIVTRDGTRVFVCVSFAALCWLLRDFVAQRSEWSRELPVRSITALLLLASPLLPAYMTWIDGQLVSPWAFLFAGK